MGKIIRRILTIIPAVALQSLWLLLLMKWLTPYAPIIVSLLSVAAFFLVVLLSSAIIAHACKSCLLCSKGKNRRFKCKH